MREIEGNLEECRVRNSQLLIKSPNLLCILRRRTKRPECREICFARRKDDIYVAVKFLSKKERSSQVVHLVDRNTAFAPRQVPRFVHVVKFVAGLDRVIVKTAQ